MGGSASAVSEREAPAPPASFEGFFEAEHARLLRALYLLSGNVQEAEELMQDALWAARAARKVVGAAEGGAAFAAADERDALARALATLPERQRAALVLTELLGYGSEEAGRILGVRDVTVRSLASQARAAL